MTRPQNGFTPIEMMIVIIGILAAIAITNYQEYVKKSRRTDAAVAISKIQQAQENGELTTLPVAILGQI